MKTIQHKLRVISNKKLCPNFWCLSLEGKSLAPKIRPGQFVHIRTTEGYEPFFRRPFSVYRALKNIEIFYEVVGPGTHLLSEKKPGEVLDVLAPLGQPFPIPERSVRHVVMIAGGIGVAPFMILSDILKNKNVSLTLLYGGRTAGHVFDLKEFKRNKVRTLIATDDGSVGHKGRVSGLFAKISTDPKTTLLYTCGPNPMMKAVQDFAAQKGLKGYAACEEVMACALGACLGCSIETKDGYKTVCYDGPVFELDKVVFD